MAIGDGVVVAAKAERRRERVRRGRVRTGFGRRSDRRGCGHPPRETSQQRVDHRLDRCGIDRCKRHHRSASHDLDRRTARTRLREPQRRQSVEPDRVDRGEFLDLRRRKIRFTREPPQRLLGARGEVRCEQAARRREVPRLAATKRDRIAPGSTNDAAAAKVEPARGTGSPQRSSSSVSEGPSVGSRASGRSLARWAASVAIARPTARRSMPSSPPESSPRPTTSPPSRSTTPTAATPFKATDAFSDVAAGTARASTQPRAATHAIAAASGEGRSRAAGPAEATAGHVTSVASTPQTHAHRVWTRRHRFGCADGEAEGAEALRSRSRGRSGVSRASAAAGLGSGTGIVSPVRRSALPSASSAGSVETTAEERERCLPRP